MSSKKKPAPTGVWSFFQSTVTQVGNFRSQYRKNQTEQVWISEVGVLLQCDRQLRRLIPFLIQAVCKAL
ncbi:MAG TPA: hypothetical protein V6C65_11125 [Allocoleopsis sp.]